jgi:hypothetical protein
MNVDGLLHAVPRSRDRRNERGLINWTKVMTNDDRNDEVLPRHVRGPVAARAALGTALLEAIAADFMRYGKDAVEALRKERPHDYVKLVAALLPKDFQTVGSILEDMTDHELANVLSAVRSLVAATAPDRDGGGNAAADDLGSAQS